MVATFIVFYLSYCGILFYYLNKIYRNNNNLNEPIDNMDNLLKDNRFKLKNYNSNPLFEERINKWHKRLRKVTFSDNNIEYIIPNNGELEKNKLWWSMDDYMEFIDIYKEELDNNII